MAQFPAADQTDEVVDLIRSSYVALRTRTKYEGNISRMAASLLADPRTAHCVNALNDIERFFASRLNDGMGSSGLSGYRSALKFEFKEQETDFGPFEEKLSTFFRGIKRVGTKHKRDEGGETREGKEPLDVGLYRRLAKMMMTSEKETYRWAHAYSILSWNLICRSNNTGHIHVDGCSGKMTPSSFTLR